jgi:hypothetical protein
MVFNTPSACGGVINLSFWAQGLPWGLIPFIGFALIWGYPLFFFTTREDFRARPITLTELGQLACQRLVEDLP